MDNKFVIAVLVSNISGVLSRVSGMFTRRGFNIDSLTVGETESSGFSRITISFHGDDDIKERIFQQLKKLHDVREVEVLNANETVIRELLLIKVRNKPESRQDVMTAVEIFRSKIDAFIELLKPCGIMEMCRTGIVAVERGDNCLKTVK